jgi:FKBP-type peptidyl-prolyl cis-trans isomerase FkpA
MPKDQAPMERITDDMKRALLFAQEMAENQRHAEINTLHVLCGIAQLHETHIGVWLNANLSREKIQAYVLSLSLPKAAPGQEIELAQESKRMLIYSVDKARYRGRDQINETDLMLGILKYKGCYAYTYLTAQQISDQDVAKALYGPNSSNVSNPLDNTSTFVFEVFKAMWQDLQQFASTFFSTPKETSMSEQQTFLDNKAKEDGVIATGSGLLYRVVREGTGPKPSANNVVRVHYRGALIDGKEFDSSYKRNEPAEFPLNRVIAGWTEGVQLMAEGATYEFYIPAKLGYGDRGAGRDIPGGATLIFTVELLKVM